MTVGQGLADARRNLGLSLEALSSQTGFSVGVLRAIEETDLPRLPSGAALGAAVRAYAAAVQLDAEAVTERYVARLSILPNTADALRAFEPEGDEHRLPGTSGLFVFESAYDPSLSRASAPRVVDAAGSALLLRAEPKPGSPSPVVAHKGGAARVLPPATGRATNHFPVAVLLLVSALAVVAGYLLSARGDWWPREGSPRTTNRVVADDNQQTRQSDPNVAQAVAPATAPSLPAHAANSAEADPQPGIDPSVPSAVIVVPGSRPASVPATTESPATAPMVQGELSGSWNVIAHDEASSAETDTNRVAYYLRLEQRGTQVVGSGYRVSADGAEGASSQKSVGVRGTLSGHRLTLNFTGQNRERFVLYRSDDGVFRGRFRRNGGPAGRSSVVTLSPKQSAR